MSSKSNAAFNLEESLLNLGGDEELFQEIAEMFFEESQENMALLRAAIDAGDSQNIMKSAHALKGMVSNFAAHGVRAPALRLEKMGRRSELADAGATFTLLEVHINELGRALRETLTHMS